MKDAPSFLEQAAVGHLMRQRVLEGVLDVGKEPYLVQELRGLQSLESRLHDRLVGLGESLEQREWHVLADHCGNLQQVLVLRREPIDTRG